MDFKHNMDKINNGVVTAMDENGTTDIKSPIKRLGSTRKLLLFNNIRLQLNEQLRCLDIRMESQVSLIQELQDFFRRRGEVELDYSKSLDKLAKSLQLRHKEQKQKREQWPMFSSYACWQQMVNQTKSLSRDHAALAEIYSTHLITRLQTVIEDVQRIYRKCREIGYETHEEILRVLQELHKTMKTYHSYQTECKAMETKLKAAEAQKAKVQMSIAKEKLEKSKKYRLIEKEVLKRKDKYKDAKLKALRAKNEYQLCLEASNTTIHKYFVDDLSDLIDCMDLGFHSMVSRALLMHVTADQGRCRSVLQGSDALSHIVHSMDSRADKQKFLEQHHGAFMIPKKIEFQGQHMDDDVIESDIQKSLYTDMETRLQHLGQRVGNLRAESEEIWKTLETAETNLLEILNEKDYDCSPFFGDASLHAAVKLESMAKTNKSDRQEIEEFYISKIREFILGTSRIARLDSKADLLRQALAKDSLRITNTTTVTKSIITKRKRIGRMNISGQPKLFGGSLEEYLEATNEEIPLIMRSCIRVINLFGLHHQGIFRVSGSQVEISNFREGFERGDDPLADTTDASDINSVAGVLKLYLRELREPLFPIIYFEHFIQLAQLKSKHDLVKGLQHFLTSLPKSVIIVIRYLFAFLNHLSEYSDENMMDAYNLAICFGPTLMPAPEDKDQVQYQNQVNELIKNMIELHEDLFPKDLGGIQYEKYISQDQFIDIDVGDSPVDQITEDPDSEVYPSEDESDILEATAQFDFNARSNRELSLCKGDTVILKKQVSNDWWHGTVRGKDGLIPDKYISLKIKDEDRDKISEQMKSSSSEESVRRRRPSGTIITRPQLKMHNPSIDTSINQSVLKTSSGSDIKMVTGQTQKPKPVQEYQNLPVTTNGMCSNTKQSVKDTESHSSLVETKSNSSESNVDNHNKELHYESVDAIKAKYEYHDEPNCFESSMDYLEDYSNQFQFETKKPTEPIYAEPNKTQQTTIKKSDPSDDSDKVVLRNSSRRQQTEQSTSNISNKDNSNVKHDSLPINLIDKTSRFSESDLGKKESITEGKDGSNQPSRKYHTKSFSLSENRVASQLFLQSRDLWEKRTEMASHQNLNQQRILSRSRIAPDLVMDLPLSIGGTTDMTSTSSDQIPFMSESLDNMTAAERFAAQSQNTLKKNDRVVTDQLDDKHEMQTDLKDCDKNQGIISDEIKEKVNKMEDVLRIEESGDRKSAGKDLIKSSPIPSRNTQKFVNQFADLHLTGGCKTTETGSPLVSSLSGSGGQQPMSSFKPQVRTKPQILRKPLVLPPTTPEMSRRHKE